MLSTNHLRHSLYQGTSSTKNRPVDPLISNKFSSIIDHRNNESSVVNQYSTVV